MLFILFAVVGALFTAVSAIRPPVVYTSPLEHRFVPEQPADWKLVNRALYAYCKPLNTCSEWRYQGYNLFSYYGDKASAPENLTLTVQFDPVKNLTAVRCSFIREWIYNREVMEILLTDYCRPLGTCDDWWYSQCGQYAFNGSEMTNHLPFSLAAVIKELPYEQTWNFPAWEYPIAMRQRKDWLPIPHPLLDPETCKPLNEPDSNEVFPTDVCVPSLPNNIFEARVLITLIATLTILIVVMIIIRIQKYDQMII